jgi:hypothetical protein
MSPEPTEARSHQAPLTFAMRCPLCGQHPIYFCRPEHGGCAFFDELGGSWPKHECFDQPQPPNAKRATPVYDPGLRAGPTWPPRAANTHYKAEIVERHPLTPEASLILVALVGYDLVLPLLMKAGGRPTRRGWIFAKSHRELAYGSAKSRNFTRLYGPAFSCWDIEVWRSGRGADAALMLLSRDLGLARFEAFGGLPPVGFLRPAWQDAIAAARDALETYNPSFMEEVVAITLNQLSGSISRSDRAELSRRMGLFRRCDDMDRPAHYEAMMDLVPF